MSKPLRLALILAVLGALAGLTATGGRPLFWLDMLLGAAIWFGLGYGIGRLIWGRSEKAQQRARIGGRSAASYLDEIPKTAPLPDQLEQLDLLRQTRKISEADYKSAKAAMIAPASIAPSKSNMGRHLNGRWTCYAHERPWCKACSSGEPPENAPTQGPSGRYVDGEWTCYGTRGTEVRRVRFEQTRCRS